MGLNEKSDFFIGGGGLHEKQIYRGELPKKGRTWRQFADLRGAWQKRGGGGGVFLRGELHNEASKIFFNKLR